MSPFTSSSRRAFGLSFIALATFLFTAGLSRADSPDPATIIVDETVTLSARVPEGMVAIGTNSRGRWFVVGGRQSSGLFEERLGFHEVGVFDYEINAYPRKSPTSGADYTRPTALARYRLDVRSTVSASDYWQRVLAMGRLPTAATARDDAAYDYTRIDAYARAVPPSALATPRTVARYLARGAANERERARAIFIWIHDNIRYEVTDVIDPDPVFVARKGQCAAMMLLFRDMASEVGLVNHGVGGEAGASEGGHAWNVVLIDGTWRLVDPTWGQFFVPPEDLAKSRFTISQYGVFALLDRPLTRFDFYRALSSAPPEDRDVIGLRRLVSAHDGRCFAELADASVGLRECEGTSSERWLVEPRAGQGGFQLTNAASGRVLGLQGSRRDVAGEVDLRYPYYDEVGDRLGTTPPTGRPGSDKEAWGFMALGPAGELTIYNRWSHKILSQQQHGGALQQPFQANARSRFRLEAVEGLGPAPLVSSRGGREPYGAADSSLALGYYPPTGRWYPIEIDARAAEHVDFRWLADGSVESTTVAMVRAFDWHVGLALQCKWSEDGLYYPGTIVGLGDTSLTLRWDDGGELQDTPLGACRTVVQRAPTPPNKTRRS